MTRFLDDGRAVNAGARHRGRAYRPDPAGVTADAFTSPWTPNHRQLEALVDQVAHRLGWRIQATHDSRGEAWSADSGWPDRFLARWVDDPPGSMPRQRNRAIVIEIKVPPDQVNEEQLAWLSLLDGIPGIEAIVFRSCGDRARDMAALADLLA